MSWWPTGRAGGVPPAALMAAAFLCLLAAPSWSQSDPVLLRCVYPEDPPEQVIAEKIMVLPLPYLDKQFIYYRDDNGQPTGAYAARRALRIYFYDKNDILMGTAIRRSQQVTAYFDPNGNYLGDCIDHKLVRPVSPFRRFDPGAKADQP